MKHKYVAVFQLILCNRFNILRNLITTEQTVTVLYIFIKVFNFYQLLPQIPLFDVTYSLTSLGVDEQIKCCQNVDF